MNLIEKTFAQTWDFLAPDDTPGATDWQTIVSNVINLIIMIAGAAAIIYLIYSGILYITAAGNPDAAKKGQQGIINAVIGIVIITLVYFIAHAAVSIGGNIDTV